MDWRNAPTGMIRHDELLNALLAIWKTQQSMARRNNFDEFSHGFQAGFEEGLDAIAQIAGLTELFDIGKNSYRTKLRNQLDPAAKIIETQVTALWQK